MEELFEKELRLAHKHHEEEIKRLVICAQRCALNEVFNHFMEKANAIDHLTNSTEYYNLATLARGDRFIRLQDAWFNAFYKSRLYTKIAEEISEIIDNKFHY